MRFSQHDINCIGQARSLIEADISRHYTIEYISEKTGIGKTKLKKGFMYLYGYGLFTYLRRVRMVKATELLANTDKSIKEIAGLTGFLHPGNFTQAFTKEHNISPAKYRQLHNKNHTVLYLP